MSELAQIFAVLRQRLKVKGMTYRDLAAALKISEPSVKRLFSRRRLPVDRLIEIAGVLGFTLAELTHEASHTAQRLHTLTEAQEGELVADEKLLLVAVCVLNQWTVPEICATYALSEAECILRLTQLGRLQLIRLLPGNRVRLNVTRDFDWLPDGPISRYFREQGLGDFLQGAFAGDQELLLFSHGMLSEAAIGQMQAEMRKLKLRFGELHEASLAAPLPKRRGCGMILALREWEPAGFVARRRRPDAGPSRNGRARGA